MRPLYLHFPSLFTASGLLEQTLDNTLSVICTVCIPLKTNMISQLPGVEYWEKEPGQLPGGDYNNTEPGH